VKTRLVLGLAGALLLAPVPAHAYLGPGGVITGIGAALALLFALVAAVAGVIWYPVKRLFARLRPGSTTPSDSG